MADPLRTVRVYISSDYRDMRAEREVLEAVVFPELRRRAAAIGVKVVKIDPCYGVSEEEAEGDGAILERLVLATDPDVCFVGLLGTRYGQVRSRFPEAARRRFPWLSEQSGASLVDLETRLALSEPRKRCLFYLRDDRFLAELPPARRGELLPENESYAELLVALKNRARTSRRPFTRDYTCRWSAASGELIGLEVFARQVTADLWTVIRELTRRTNTPYVISCPHCKQQMQLAGGSAGKQFRCPFCKNVFLAPPPAVAPPPAPPGPFSGGAFAGPQPRSVPQPLTPSPVAFDSPRPNLLAHAHENVQFTVYRPRAVEPARWYDLLAFAHLDELPDDAPPGQPEPAEEVARQAKGLLGARLDDYKKSTQDSRAAVPPEGEITFVPRVPGVSFNPPSRTFLFVETVHREEFRLRADASLMGQTARGAMSVYLGSILLAEVPLSLRVEQAGTAPKAEPPPDRSSARPYRKIFASYSHKDLAVVEELERYARTLGDRYLRDWVDLRAGQQWNDRLLALIEEADVFQLFWSTNAMASPFVEREWRHALALGRANFVRPTYWEQPLPTAPDRGLPPEELTRLHFHFFTREGRVLTDPANSVMRHADPSSCDDVVKLDLRWASQGGSGSDAVALEGSDTDREDSDDFDDEEDEAPITAGRRTGARGWVIAIAIGLLVLVGLLIGLWMAR